MALKVSIDLSRKFIVSADSDHVFALLSDVEASAAHFPKVHAITKIGDNRFKWEMEKVNLGTHSAQTAYACEYIANSTDKTVEWFPIKGEGNSEVSGKWTIKELSAGTELSFVTKAVLTLPLPGLLKLAISPMVKMEFAGMVDTYITNIKTVLV
ncbi:SRPBCC family protein [Glaciecola petra]|uniref:SRPBCC family protein n=1 Tax=Glaciecola petra TaxID=3075602 RepID=A0ABU2ZND5_9ALTE|nr:SRPBCC family protein [Aestuariibacter sp. P117]MDT0594134.1 SRPBCC family protein [Aestuariibacter sp. P117]